MANVTPSQTVGPYLHIGLEWKDAHIVAGDSIPGRIRIEGQVADFKGQATPDCMVEIWQANAAGRYDHPADRRDDKKLTPGFKGFGRCSTDAQGMFRFVTVKPGAVPGPGNALQAPHIALGIFGRGLLKRLYSRLYFPDEPLNDADPVLNLVDPARRGTLIARKVAGGDLPTYRLDIRLQGGAETVFFEA
ncbi:MAG: protocatechuate 3,4-dioxygenase subunit alpha [Alphaproteobacteria bacterium]|nr:protocatechuate 3,4-dioxygenase subunit alpha [Alphaproteobacteria bacterium]